jgi:two-component system chemotaxis response regulator CheB
VGIVCIAASTGGPNAIEVVLPALPADFPVPIVIVQHMPPMFTRQLAQRLATRCALEVREAKSGEALQPGTALIAPGDFHVAVRSRASGAFVVTNQDPPENSCRPSADFLLRSAAEAFGERTLAVVLTGMGQDGLKGCQVVRAAGGKIVVQDEPTSVVWGMPGAVARAGLAGRVLPIECIAADILRRAREGRT